MILGFFGFQVICVIMEPFMKEIGFVWNIRLIIERNMEVTYIGRGDLETKGNPIIKIS